MVAPLSDDHFVKSDHGVYNLIVCATALCVLDTKQPLTQAGGCLVKDYIKLMNLFCGVP